MSALRHALHGPKRHEVQAALGWDDSEVSRFLSGGKGIVIDKIDTLVAAVGFVCVTRKYLDADARAPHRRRPARGVASPAHGR
ncbi:hypothetical protein [Burkholderia pseudomallei]|uniref:hypothetical protein n=1 Tax=Burkholderia pseudomallei TaxID=28450 RepID=UPI003463F1C4